MKGKNKAVVIKILGIICTLCVLISAIYVPLSFSTSAAAIPVTADTETVFTFEEGEGTLTGMGEDGVGLSSWGITKRTNSEGETGIGLKHTDSSAYWSNPGGFRLNNKDGIYYLDANSTYVVSFKLQVKSGPVKKGAFTSDSSSSLSLGFGYKNTQAGNPAGAMHTTVSEIYTSKAVDNAEDSTFDLTTAAGVNTYKAGDTWYDLTYVFTTPSTFASGYCTGLGFFAVCYHGTEFLIDDVKVTKLGEDKGAVLFVDAYYNTVTAKTGVVGETVALDALTTENEEHEFIGWYKDSGRNETADGLVFTKATQTVYSAWKAPVSVTFIDSYNNKEYTSTGLAGEKIEYPAEPADEQNDPDNIWFMGWYTTESHTEEFTQETFAYNNVTVYSKWLSEIAPQVQDFENYTRDSRKTTTITVGGEQLKKYSNRLYFGYSMNKVDDPTDDNRGKVIDFTWDKEMVIDPQNPATYDAATRYSTLDNLIHMENIILEKGTIYTVTFDYFVEELDDGVEGRISVLSSNPSDIYTGAVNYGSTDGAVHRFTSEEKDGEWHQGTFTFIPKFSDPKNNGIHFLFGMSENANMKVYIDNVVFNSAQPYEAYAIYDFNNGKPPVTYEGKRGEALPEIIPENGGLKFLGWYADKELTTPFTQTTYGYKMATAYAKWSGTVIEFNNYSYASNRYMFNDLSMSIDKTDGYEDKFSVNWHYDGDKWSPYQKNYVCARDSVMDDMVGLLRLENNKTYELSYYVRVNSANSDFSIRLMSGAGGSVWDGGNVYYPSTIINISADEAGKGWMKKSVVFTTNFGTDAKNNSADFMYLLFYTVKKNMDTDVNVNLDCVSIVEVTENVVMFNGNADGVDSAYQIGAVGDDIVFPTLKNGDAKFLGWFSDAECETPFTATKIAEGQTDVYAKWSAVANDFSAYKYASSSHYVFGKNMRYYNEAGVGYNGDNYTLRFDFDGTRVWQTDANGKETTWNERGAGAVDNIARLGTLQNNTIYKISYYYKSNSGTNVDANITFLTCNNNNIWGSGRVSYPGTTQVVPLKNTEWTKAEAVIYTDFADPSYNMLYIGFGAEKMASGNTRIIVDVDNVLIEKVETPYIYFDTQNDSGEVEYYQGVKGGKIKLLSDPFKTGYDFVGWFLDKEATIPFTQTVFGENDKIIVYAGYKKSNTATFGFENYKLTSPEGWRVFGDGAAVTKGIAYSGEYSIKYDRGAEIVVANSYRGGYLQLGDNKTGYEIELGQKYIATFKYYIEANGTKDATVSMTSAHKTSYWHNMAGISVNSFVISNVSETGVWKTGALVIDTANSKTDSLYAFISVYGGNDGVYYIDDVKLEKMPEGYTAYSVTNNDCNSIPLYVMGKPGTSFMSKLPTNPKKDNHVFKGYTIVDESGNEEELTAEKAVFGDAKIRIRADFVRLNTVQTFDDNYDTVANYYAAYSAMDYDWEHYDSQKEGNSKDNVTSGRYSIHRKGTTMYFENAQVLTKDKLLSVGERYTVTMKVKLGKHLQTDGAIKFASCRGPYYPWSTTGDYYPIVAIADLKEGEWKEVSYTFNSVEALLAIQTPGYCEIFIDDIVITRVDESTPLSTPISFTEYVPAERDEMGNLIDINASDIDISTIIDASLFEEEELTFMNKAYIFVTERLVAVIAAGAGVLLLIAGTVVLVIIKKRKAKKS